MPRTEEQNRERRAATRAALITTAMDLFVGNGYTHTTTREIAEAAGISVGLMYHYFPSKEALLQAVLDHSLLPLEKAFTDVFAETEPPARLGRLLDTIFSLLARDTAFWSLFYALRTQPAIAALLRDDLRAWTHRLRDLFESELRQMGRADPALDALLLYSLIEGTIQQYLLDPDDYPLDQVAGAIIARYRP